MEESIFALVEQIRKIDSEFEKDFLDEFLFDLSENFQFSRSREYYERKFYDLYYEYECFQVEISDLCFHISVFLR